jgi:hypothetical protein
MFGQHGVLDGVERLGISPPLQCDQKRDLDEVERYL